MSAGWTIVEFMDRGHNRSMDGAQESLKAGSERAHPAPEQVGMLYVGDVARVHRRPQGRVDVPRGGVQRSLNELDVYRVPESRQKFIRIGGNAAAVVPAAKHSDPQPLDLPRSADSFRFGLRHVF